MWTSGIRLDVKPTCDYPPTVPTNSIGSTKSQKTYTGAPTPYKKRSYPRRLSFSSALYIPKRPGYTPSNSDNASNDVIDCIDSTSNDFVSITTQWTQTVDIWRDLQVGLY